MKGILIAAVISPLLVLSCFDAAQEKDTSRVVMTIASPPSANIARLHVGVFAGLVLPETLILKQTFEAGSLVALIVPSGPYRVFLVWAEDSFGYASHYGVSLPFNLTGENTASVPMEMYPINDYPAAGNTYFGYQESNGGYTVSWNTLPGATEYELQAYLNRIVGFVSIYVGTANSYTYTASLGKTPVRGRASSSIFGISTVMSNAITLP